MRAFCRILFFVGAAVPTMAGSGPTPAVFIEGKGENGFSVTVLKEHGDVRREVVRRLKCLDVWSEPDPIRRTRIFICDDIEFFFDASSHEFVFTPRVDNGAISASIGKP